MSKRGSSSNDSSKSRSQSPSTTHANKSTAPGSRKRTHLDNGSSALSSTNYTGFDPSAPSTVGFRSFTSRIDIHDNTLPSTRTYPKLQDLAPLSRSPLRTPTLLPPGVAGAPPVDQQYAAFDSSFGSDFRYTSTPLKQPSSSSYDGYKMCDECDALNSPESWECNLEAPCNRCTTEGIQCSNTLRRNWTSIAEQMGQLLYEEPGSTRSGVNSSTNQPIHTSSALGTNVAAEATSEHPYQTTIKEGYTSKILPGNMCDRCYRRGKHYCVSKKGRCEECALIGSAYAFLLQERRRPSMSLDPPMDYIAQRISRSCDRCFNNHLDCRFYRPPCENCVDATVACLNERKEWKKSARARSGSGGGANQGPDGGQETQ